MDDAESDHEHQQGSSEDEHDGSECVHRDRVY